MLSSVLIRASLDALFQRGEDLRGRADTVLREYGFQATGWGSPMGMHTTDAAIRRASDLEGTDKRPIELLFREMLERGVYIGKNGFVTLPLPLLLSLPQTPETDERFLTALESSMRVVAEEALQEPSSGSAAPY
ncbi:hypothetical protein [Streptomyces vietnamensis]|uniref:hypothetical protein n=1 Tax=Streptomyces vietnamensis TaxID=362257 RepID=UPI00342E2F8D